MEGFNPTIILVPLLILLSSMDFKHKIIQWNCRGLKHNYNEVFLLISEYNPPVFCFQETFLKLNENISLKGISFDSRNTHLLPPKSKSSFCHLKRGIQDFHMNYVLVPADKAANNFVVV